MTGKPLVPVITRVGKAGLINDSASGFDGDISRIGFGLGRNAAGKYVGYTPTNDATALATEVVRVPLLQGTRLGSDGFRVLARLPAGSAPEGTPFRELGVYLTSGELLCLWSDPALPVAYASELADFDLSFDLILSQLPVDRLSITVMEPDIPDTLGVLAQLVALGAREATQFTTAGTRDLRTIFGEISA